jgi:hypothetical protein
MNLDHLIKPVKALADKPAKRRKTLNIKYTSRTALQQQKFHNEIKGKQEQNVCCRIVPCNKYIYSENWK